MFGSKKCNNCGKDLKKDWVACPYCGQPTEDKKSVYRRPFQSFFDTEDIDKEFERIDKMFGGDVFKFPRMDIESPFKGGGISITIRSGTGMKPQINVKTSGNYKKVEPELKRKLGVREGISEEVEEEPRRERKIPKITEEPETDIKRTVSNETITIKLPDVKNEDDIEIRKLEQSLEVKAFAGDKAYFKLIPIKRNFQILEKDFKDGILKIEMGV